MKKHLDLAFKFRKHDVLVLSFGGLPTMMCPTLPRLSYVSIGILRKAITKGFLKLGT